MTEIIAPSAKTNVQNNRSPFMVAQQFSGPIPPASELEKYEKILPGLAERIVAMAENQSKHRQVQESTLLNSQVKHLERRDEEATRGQWFAFLIAVTFIVSGSLVAIFGNAWAGGFISVVGMAPIIYAFINGRNSQTEATEMPKK